MGTQIKRSNLDNAFMARMFGTPLNISHYTKGSFETHYHAHLEIMIINKSAGEQRIGKKRYALERGTAFFLGQFHSHSIFKTGPENLDYYNITFKPEVLNVQTPHEEEVAVLRPFYMPELVNPLRIPDSNYTKITRLCGMMLDENNRSSPRAPLLNVHLFNTILLYLTENLPLPSDGKELIALRCLSRINTRFRSELKTETLAAHVGLSPSRLAQVFRKATGRTVKEMLIQRRLTEARKLLTETTQPVAEICEQAGFRDSSYFHRTFRRETGCSPREYRQRLKATH